MNIKLLLETEHSKAMIVRIANYIGNNKKKFKGLMDLMLGDDERLSQRSSWAVNYCVEAHPDLIYPYLGKMLKNLERPLHNGIKRNTIRILQFIELPEEHQGHIAELCFQFLADPKEAIAVRCFSMEVLHRICLLEPELSEELCLTIEAYMPFSSAGFKSRGRKVLKALRK